MTIVYGLYSAEPEGRDTDTSAALPREWEVYCDVRAVLEVPALVQRRCGSDGPAARSVLGTTGDSVRVAILERPTGQHVRPGKFPSTAVGGGELIYHMVDTPALAGWLDRFDAREGTIAPKLQRYWNLLLLVKVGLGGGRERSAAADHRTEPDTAVAGRVDRL